MEVWCIYVSRIRMQASLLLVQSVSLLQYIFNTYPAPTRDKMCRKEDYEMVVNYKSGMFKVITLHFVITSLIIY